jgi:hypothetical protein
MNIDDVNSQVKIDDSLMGQVIVHRALVRQKYDIIEARNGIMIPLEPYDLNDYRLQIRVKDLFWRATEELAEAVEAWTEPTRNHFNEELADAFHFFVEACCLTECLWDDTKIAVIQEDCWQGLDRALPRSSFESFEMYCFSFVTQMGLAANCLKNKPWKQTQMMTDQVKFRIIMDRAWAYFCYMLSASRLKFPEFCDLVLRKGEVNKFRQRSNY